MENKQQPSVDVNAFQEYLLSLKKIEFLLEKLLFHQMLQQNAGDQNITATQFNASLQDIDTSLKEYRKFMPD